jgi:hypothetical protein
MWACLATIFMMFQLIVLEDFIASNILILAFDLEFIQDMHDILLYLREGWMLYKTAGAHVIIVQ